MHHQHLAVDTTAGAYAYHGDAQLRSHACGKRGWYLFEHEGETAYLLEHTCVGQKFFGFGLFFCAHGVCSEFVDGLRCKSEMSHHGYAGA